VERVRANPACRYCDRNPNFFRLLDFDELISIGSNLRFVIEAGTPRFVCLKPHV
jgi:hypothetical protein